MDPTNLRECSHYRSKKWILGFIIECVVLLLFAWGWYIFVFEVGVTILRNRIVVAIVLNMIYHTLMVMSVASLFRTTFTDPGSVPPDFTDTKYTPMFQTTNEGKPRFCKVCNLYKPDRARHCSSCGKCVLKMDHHCPWVNNCVGFRNYKFFCLFVFYTSILCIYVAISALVIVMSQVRLSQIKSSEIQLIVLGLIGGAFAIALVSFCVTHLRFVLLNLTTIESFNDDAEKNNVYNIGKKKNWEQVFGNRALLYMFPFANYQGDGLRWEVNNLAHASPINIDEQSPPLDQSFDEKSTLL